MKTSKSNTLTLIAASVIAFSMSTSVMANTPTMNLIPVTAIESIKQSANTAKAMENQLTQVIERIESQKSLYDSAKCEGAVNDKGCEQMFNSINGSFKEFLVVLNDELPALSQQLNTTAISIGKQIHKELGKGMTPVDIQRLVSGRRSNGKSPIKARKGNNSHSMVSMLENIGKVVSTGGHGDTAAVVASDIFVNMTLAHQQIAQIQADISQTLATIDTYSAFGQLSPGQLDTVASVKALLFGEVDGGGIPGEEIVDVPTETYTWEQSL